MNIFNLYYKLKVKFFKKWGWHQLITPMLKSDRYLRSPRPRKRKSLSTKLRHKCLKNMVKSLNRIDSLNTNKTWLEAERTLRKPTEPDLPSSLINKRKRSNWCKRDIWKHMWISTISPPTQLQVKLSHLPNCRKNTN